LPTKRLAMNRTAELRCDRNSEVEARPSRAGDSMMPSPEELPAFEREHGIRIRRILHGDVPTFMEVPHASRREHLKGADVAVLGIPWEGFIYGFAGEMLPPGAKSDFPDFSRCRWGANEAPDMIRRFSKAYSILENGGYFPELDRNLRIADRLKVVDYGNAAIIPADVEASFQNAEKRVTDIVRAGALPIVFGGDHGITYPVLRGISKAKRTKIGIIDFDSHFDFGELPKRHAAWQFLGAFELRNYSPKNMVQIGIRNLDNPKIWSTTAKKLGVTTFTIADVEEKGIAEIVKMALDIASKNTSEIYITLDVDVLDPAFCPAQKYPDAGGITSREILCALRIIGKHELAGFDVTCLSPRYDTPNNYGSLLVARCAATVIGTLALKKMKK